MKSNLNNVYKPGIVSLKNDCSANSKELLSLKNEMREMKLQISTLMEFMKSFNDNKESNNSEQDSSSNDEKSISHNSEEALSVEEKNEDQSLENLEPADIKQMVKNALKIEINEVSQNDNDAGDNKQPTFSDVNSS